MQNGKIGAYPPLRLVIEQDEGERIDQVFTHSFRVGRDVDSDVTVQNSHVSRNHVEFDYKDRCWWVHDLDSTNGIYVNGNKLMHAPIMDKDELTLGKDGPLIKCHYLSKEEAQSVYGQKPGDRLARLVPARKKMIAFVLAALILGGGGFFFGQHQLGQKDRIRDKAEVLFSNIRSADVAIANVYADQRGADKLMMAQQLIGLEEERGQDLEVYKGYLIRLGVYQALDEQEQQIFNTAQFYNESELSMPPAFIEDVKRTIHSYWLDENREAFKESLTRAQLFDYEGFIIKTLNEFGLPNEFFYLPLTVSGFDADGQQFHESGKETAGIWQLSVSSGKKIGLVEETNNGGEFFLSKDDRHNFSRSTRAAVSYLHDIYREESMASGLMTLALYLQYEQEAAPSEADAMRSVLNDLPKDVYTRNIWSVRERYPNLISEKVYQQVVRIFSASVIGQDPSLFGLNVTTPTLSNSFKTFR